MRNCASRWGSPTRAAADRETKTAPGRRRCRGAPQPATRKTRFDRFGLVTVEQQQYRIADIGMRMLEPRELYRAQGFHESYQIAPGINGKPLPKRAQVRMCGNSVSPPLAAALARANVPELMTFNARELRALEAA